MPHVKISLPHDVGFTIETHDRDDKYVSEEIIKDQRWEPLETEVISRLLKQDADFVDVGANIGWYSLLAGKLLGRRGIVHAFEPAAENVALLARNVALNCLANVRITPCAVGGATGSARIFYSPINKGDHRAYPSDEERPSQEIGMIKLDDYFRAEPPRPLVVKVDTQGFEYDVLSGMRNTLAALGSEVVLVIEFWPYGLTQNGVAAAILLDLLLQAGFEPSLLVGDDVTLRRTSLLDLAAAAHSTLAPETQRFVNLVLSRPGGRFADLLGDLLSDEPSELVPRR
jgi:FkbM family methyltransferase